MNWKKVYIYLVEISVGSNVRRAAIQSDNIIIYYNHIFDGTGTQRYDDAIWTQWSLRCHRPKINFSDANFRTFIRKSGHNSSTEHTPQSRSLCLKCVRVFGASVFFLCAQFSFTLCNDMRMGMCLCETRILPKMKTNDIIASKSTKRTTDRSCSEHVFIKNRSDSCEICETVPYSR